MPGRCEVEARRRWTGGTFKSACSNVEERGRGISRLCPTSTTPNHGDAKPDDQSGDDTKRTGQHFKVKCFASQVFRVSSASRSCSPPVACPN
jgi:hypothetical protein